MLEIPRNNKTPNVFEFSSLYYSLNMIRGATNITVVTINPNFRHINSRMYFLKYIL